MARLYQNQRLWRDVNIGPEGHYIFRVPVPERPAPYILTALSVSSESGFSLLEEPLRFHSERPFYSTIDTPPRIRAGEQLGIRVALFNFQPMEIEVLVALEASADYDYIHVEAFGVVQSYAPRLSSGELEHQHLVWLAPYETTAVHMPIVAKKQYGTIEVRVRASTGIAEDRHSRKIRVYADGVPQRLHTSTLLDLSHRAVVIKYLDVNTTETNIIPRQRERLYVSGSPRVFVSLVGDIYGAAFPTMPMSAWQMMRRPADAGEGTAFNMAVNVLTLHYLRMTNQVRKREV